MAIIKNENILRYLQHPNELVLNTLFWMRSSHQLTKFAFIVGPPRSGTTLLQTIMLNHEAIKGFSDETGIFSYRSLFFFERFKNYLSRAVYDNVMSTSRDINEFFSRIHEESLGVAENDSAWYLEKTPQHAKFMRHILKYFANARVIFIARDGRDGFCSGRSAGNIPQATSVESYARYWMDCVKPRTMIQDDRILDISYENFVAEPEAQVTKILDFLGLQGDPSQLLAVGGRTKDPRSETKAFARLSSKIDSSSVERWRSEMTEQERTLFWNVAGPGLQYLNYRK